MKLTKNEKIEKSKQLAETLKKAPHLFFTEYQGLKFVELDELRAKLRPGGPRRACRLATSGTCRLCGKGDLPRCRQ